MPSNLYSLAESQFYPGSRSKAVCADEVLVGYALYSIEEATGHWKVFRLMIAERFQGKGYGKAAMKSVLEELRLEGAKAVVLRFYQKNDVARKLYESLGFVEMSRTETHVTAQCLLD